MTSAEPLGRAAPTEWTDEELVDRVLSGDTASFELIVRRHNSSLFRVARGIVGNGEDAEDALQEAYVKAFRALSRFESRSSFRTWLVRITINEARMRLRRDRRLGVVRARSESELASAVSNDPGGRRPRRPDHETVRGELREVLEQEIDSLPEPLREVFVLRELEGAGTAEVADLLTISEANVRVRLHRARATLRGRLRSRIGSLTAHLYEFGGEQCDRITGRVLARIADES